MSDSLAGADVPAQHASSNSRAWRDSFARLLGPIVFYSLLSLIALVAVPYGTVEPWWEALFECAVFALSALWIIEGALTGRWFFKAHRIFLPVLLLVLYAFIQAWPLWGSTTNGAGLELSGAISADPYETRRLAFKLLALALAGILLLRYASEGRRLRALVYTIIGVGVLSAFFGILRQTTQHTEGFFLPFLSPSAGYAQFINRNHFAFLMEMALGLTLGLVIWRGVRRDQLLIHLAPALPVWVALVLCNSRGGLFAMLAEVLFLALLFTFVRSGRESSGREMEDENFLRRLGRATVFRPVLIVGLLVTVFLGAVWMGGEALTSRLEKVSSDAGAAGDGASRAETWRATWRMIKDHPLTGVGFNGYWVAITRYHGASGEVTPQQAHNDYLELLASGGLIGTALALWFVVLFIKGVRALGRNADSFRRAAALGACAGLFGVAAHSIVDFGLHVTINALIFTALVVVAIAGSLPQQKRAQGLPANA
ncbi:MAG TPA: O-antigen ligase family protein [Pyrinomonadaceae bacterium]|nr:O-antigen ligase family protein [Pyrinomonadaceae bacterium]